MTFMGLCVSGFTTERSEYVSCFFCSFCYVYCINAETNQIITNQNKLSFPIIINNVLIVLVNRNMLDFFILKNRLICFYLNAL